MSASPEIRRQGRPHHPSGWEIAESQGWGPFTSRVVYRLPDGSRYVWESRRHRKGLGPRDPSGQAAQQVDRAPEPRRLAGMLLVWAPQRISWWVAVAFMAGSALFVAGAVAALSPGVVGGAQASGVVSAAAYWTGALVFTASIYLWLLEGLNASDSIGILRHSQRRQRFVWFAWRPGRLDVLAPLLFLVGSGIFNVETTLAVAGELGWLEVPVAAGWLSLVGAVLFLVPSYLQLVEVAHGFVSWQPREISWWVAVSFIVGSLGFVLGAVFGVDVPGLSAPHGHLLERVGFLEGGILYLGGSYLMVPELAWD